MDTIELIEHEIKTLPQFKAQEVLDFILFLKTREMFQKKDKEQKKKSPSNNDAHSKSTKSLKSEILKIGNNCASLPLLDN